MKRILAVAFATLIFSGCSNLRVVEHNPDQVKLNNFSTFAWQEEPLVETEGSRLALADRAIRDAVNRDLASKGYQLVDSDAELLVNWRVGRTEAKMFEDQMYSIDESLGDSMRSAQTHEGDVFLASPGVVEIDQLVIVFVDSNQGKPVVGLEIRGVHDGGTTDTEISRQIIKAVGRALERVPSK